jgi:hypothetical protein
MRRYRTEMDVNGTAISALFRLAVGVLLLGLIVGGFIWWSRGGGQEQGAANSLVLTVDLPGLTEVTYATEQVTGGVILTDEDGDPWLCKVVPDSIDDFKGCTYYRR